MRLIQSKAFSLIEVLIAIVILAIGLLGFAVVIGSATTKYIAARELRDSIALSNNIKSLQDYKIQRNYVPYGHFYQIDYANALDETAINYALVAFYKQDPVERPYDLLIAIYPKKDRVPRATIGLSNNFSIGDIILAPNRQFTVTQENYTSLGDIISGEEYLVFPKPLFHTTISVDMDDI